MVRAYQSPGVWRNKLLSALSRRSRRLVGELICEKITAEPQSSQRQRREDHFSDRLLVAIQFDSSQRTRALRQRLPGGDFGPGRKRNPKQPPESHPLTRRAGATTRLPPSASP